MPGWLALEGRPTLVIGAGGLGGASAVEPGRTGARLALVDHHEENLARVAATVKEAGGDVQTFVADVRTPEACRAAVAEATELIGVPQVFLHAVGAMCASQSLNSAMTTGPARSR